MERQEIGDFLRARRAGIQPADLGLPSHGRRRVPGLRRDEVAQLAGISVDYYVRLEQGRTPHASDTVLEAISRVLDLDEAERAHLRNLIKPPPEVSKGGDETVRPGLRRMLEMMADVPAWVSGRRTDFLAWTALADAVLGISEMPGRPNGARHVFLEPRARHLYTDWDGVAAETVQLVRLAAGRHPGDMTLAAMIDELRAESDDFRTLWDQHSVGDKSTGRKLINHPAVGPLDFTYEVLVPNGADDQMMIVYTADAGSATERGLQKLADDASRTVGL